MASPVYGGPNNTQIVGYSNTPAAPGVVQNAKSPTVTSTGASYSPAPVQPSTPGSQVPPPAPAAPAPAAPGTVAAPGTTAPALPGSTAGFSSDSNYSKALGGIAPPAVPDEESFFNDVYNQLAPVISAINGAESSAETAAYAAGTQQQNDLSKSLGARGLAGSGEAELEAANTNLVTAQSIATAKQNQASALSTAYQFISGQAYTEFKDAQSRGDTLDQNYVTAMQSTAANTVKGLAESGITDAADLQAKDPNAYLSVLQYYNNDPTALNAALVMNQPVGKVAQSWMSGSTYYQVITDPITGKPKVQSMDLGVTPPTTWTQTKVSNTTILFQDPNNPSNTIVYTTDPISGSVNVTGTGTGQSIANQYGGGGNSPSPSGGGAAPSSTASTTVASALGVDPTTSFSEVVSSAGIGSVVAAMIGNEGGSPAGVNNNPGNVKYNGGPGQTDSGVKAQDGGTFASYATPAAGEAAIASTLNSIAQGLGANATLSDVVSKYTNTAPVNATSQYGALGKLNQPFTINGSQQPAFNPSAPGDQGLIDTAAYSYLQNWMSGTQPSTTNTTGMRSSSNSVFLKVAQRAQALYQAATGGQQLPNITTQSGNLGIINTNNQLLNKLQTQTSTIQKNFGLDLSNITTNNINTAIPALNGMIDWYKEATGDPNMAQYLSQTTTLQTELSNLLAVKNAGGTTVADKIMAGDLTDVSWTPDMLQQVMGTFMKEATNAESGIGGANASLYQESDPLGINPQNPVNAPGYSEMTAAGATNNYNGTWTLGGTTVNIDADGNVTPVN